MNKTTTTKINLHNKESRLMLMLAALLIFWFCCTLSLDFIHLFTMSWLSRGWGVQGWKRPPESWITAFLQLEEITLQASLCKFINLCLKINQLLLLLFPIGKPFKNLTPLFRNLLLISELNLFIASSCPSGFVPTLVFNSSSSFL